MSNSVITSAPKPGALRRILRYAGKLVYCLWWSAAWHIGRLLYDLAEDRRPAGGFRPGNLS